MFIFIVIVVVVLVIEENPYTTKENDFPFEKEDKDVRYDERKPWEEKYLAWVKN